jgi:Calcium-activated chloride channel
MYFAWLGVYVTLLIPASLFGIGVFIYGLVTLPTSGTAYVYA